MKFSCSKLLFFLCPVLVHLLPLTIAQTNLLYRLCVVENGNYTTNSTYQTNLNQVLTSLYTNTTINYGFINSTYGQMPDQVWAIALCRPDMDSDSCSDCISIASQELTKNCTTTREAIGGYDDGGYNYCMLRYANRPIFNLVEAAPYFFDHSVINITEDVEGFKQARNSLLGTLRSQAAAGDSLNKSAAGETPSSNLTIYAYAQCTPDINESDCNFCLNNATLLLPQCCDIAIGGRVINPSCNFRFEITPIYKTQVALVPSPNTTPSKGKNMSRTVIIVVSVVIPMILIICIYIFLRARKPAEEVENVDEIKSVESLQFEFSTIRNATNNFSDANKLGQGGFGAVYKGMLSSGQDIAVKRLSRTSKQGDLEFKNEVLLLARLQHRNLVRLLGFCLERKERLLVYEFLPNKSLDHFIFDPIEREHMDWEKRYKIIGAIARGLLYLHEDSRLRIIHRDLKASNILLDSEMNPKISDFGMARLFEMDETQGDTDRVVGTLGYMAPEYVTRGHFSVKSDVFSFGVLVLEMVSGQKRSFFRIGEVDEDLLTYAWKSKNEETALNLADPTFRGSSRSEIIRCINIALLCVQDNVADRPNMAQVVIMLSSNQLTLPVPSKPAFFFERSSVIPETSSSSSVDSNSRLIESNQSRRESVQWSKAEVSITELYPR